MKKIYDAPEFELIKIVVDTKILASAEGDPGQIVDEGGDGRIE